MILVSFRFDDPSPVSNHTLEKNIFDIFQKHNINLCVGVVPFNQNNGGVTPLDKVNGFHLIEAQKKGVIEIALHGNSHIKRGTTIKGEPSEFSGLSEKEQGDLISKGKQHLTKIFGVINGFIPPWNTYDAITEKVLKDQGFAYISASWDCPPKSANYLPNIYRTVHAHHAYEAIQQASLYEDLNPVVNILFHHYDFEEDNAEKAVINLAKLDELLGWIKNHDRFNTISLSEAAKILEKFTPKNNLNYSQYCMRFPKQLRWRFPSYLMLLSPNWRVFMSVISNLKKNNVQ